MPLYRYRCDQCRTTSPELRGRRELDAAAADHRHRAHGGHIPDGERIIEQPRMRLTDLPREQRVAAVIFLAILLVATVARLG